MDVVKIETIKEKDKTALPLYSTILQHRILLDSVTEFQR